MTITKNIVVVGGGITGLTASYYLQETIKRKNLPYRVTLLEASDRLGGKIHTVHRDGFTIERGADSFLERKKHAVKLIEQLGMANRLVRNKTGQAYILLHDQLQAIPQGSFMGIPTQLKPLLSSQLFSLIGKLRIGLELFLPKGKSSKDQSLGYFLRRRLGDECVDHLIEPLLSGVYSSDIDQMSLMATFPQFYHLEQKNRSLIKGLRQTIPQERRGTGKRSGQFLTLEGGFETLIDELVNQIDEGTIKREVSVEQVEHNKSGFTIHSSHGNEYHADACLMAIPHKTVPEIFRSYDLFQPFDDIPSSSVANVVLAFDQKDITKSMNGTGFVVSRKSDYRVTACTWTNEKWPHTTPHKQVLLRAYVGKPDDQDVVYLEDEEIVNLVRAELSRIIPLQAEAKFSLVTRYPQLMPQYTVGHQERITDVKQAVRKQLPGVFLAGSSYDGVGVPDCIRQAEEAANKIICFLNNS